MKSSIQSLKAFCEFYSGRKDAEIRDCLLRWFKSDGVGDLCYLQEDISSWIEDFNLMHPNMQIDGADLTELVNMVNITYKLNLK